MDDIKFPKFWESILRRVAENKDRLVGASVVLYYDDNGSCINHCGNACDKDMFINALECVVYDCIENYDNGQVTNGDDEDEGHM